MGKKIRIIVFILFVGILTSCNPNRVKIGAILPETGDMSGLGVSMKSGLELAIEELNAQSEVKYELIIADAPTNRDVLAAYNSLRYRNKIKIFVTAGSSYSMALKPSVIQNDELLFCVASLPEITKEGSYNIFKIGNSSMDESEAIVHYLTNDNDDYKGNVVMFYPNSEYGVPFYSTINGGLNSCVCITYDESDRNFNNLATKALKNNPDKVVAIGESPALGGIIKALRTLGYKNEIVSNTMFINSNVITAAGDAAKGVIYVDYDFDGNSTSTLSRNEIIHNKYNIAFSSISFLAYSIPYIIDLKNKELSSNAENDDWSTHTISANIRSHKSILVANEYPYTLNKNGDIKPSLVLKRYE